MASKLMGKPKAPDTSKQQEALLQQEKRIAAEEEAQKKKESSALQARRARSSGRASLITGEETGVTRTTLG